MLTSSSAQCQARGSAIPQLLVPSLHRDSVMVVAKGSNTSEQTACRHSLAEFVREHEREIVASWIDALRQRPSARNVPDSSLISRISPILRWLVDAHSSGRGMAYLELLAGDLATAKAAEGTSAKEIVEGWSLLRDCLVRSWAAALTPARWLEAVIYVHRVIDSCVMAAAERLAGTRDRTLELVENVSRDTFESATLGELLQRLLQTFMKAAPEVDVAVIALSEWDCLRLRAAVGMELPEHTTLAIGEGVLGRIAAEKSPLSFRASALDPLLLHPSSNASAVRAAYGVPLVEHGSVLGIAAIGSRTAWEFSHADRVVFDVIARRAANAIAYCKGREVFDREKANLDFLLAQLPAGVIVADAPSGRVTMHNAQIERIWRRPFIPADSVEQYGAWPAYRASGQRLTPEQWPLTRAVRDGETAVNEEIEILRGDGSWGAVLVGAAPIRGPDGQVVGAVATMTDITERRSTERQLKVALEHAHRAATFQKVVAEASQQLAEAFEMQATVMSIARLGIPEIADWCAVWELCDDGNLRGIGVAHGDPVKTARLRERVSRFPIVVPSRFSRAVLEDRKPQVVPDAVEELLRDAAVDPILLDVMREFGISSFMLLPLVARGRTLGILNYACADSGRRFSPEDLELGEELARRASVALDNAHLYDDARRAAAELSGVISIAPDAIITVDGELRIVIFNEAAERIFGWKREEVVGKPVDILMPEKRRPTERARLLGFAEGLTASWTTGETASVWAARKGGEEFPGEVAISKLELGDKQFLTIVLRDITARLRTEREREAAIAMRDELMGVVAHDLRNPLGTILMLASVFQERAADDGSRKSAQALARAANRMNRLIQDLLDVARIDAGCLSIEPCRVSARQVILDCVDVQKELTASTALEIEVELTPDLADVRADADRLLQVLENLIGNAVKFSREGGRITVGARTSEGDVLFWVKDVGIGIAAEHLPYVFDRFRQFGHTRRRGAGLGLAIVKGLVEGHGGRVWAESTLGQGTTFFFTLPAEPSAT